ncbi:androgen-dependent TFPI-regulating protein [Sphaerodactylus townsendi]|uniref:androgen-dependent TFPI-regulating protein n=1 Tax=Sphaerodactylus townsendi TaxID=933632 RepID=UPI002025E634|nr:androgen-dependent TFPI-regulating protein [Sphaerodactylus townsendi]
MTPSRLLLWHGLGLAWFAYIARLTANIEALGAQAAATAGIDTYGGVWKFLTFLNLVLQAVLCGISFLVDVFTLMEKQRIAKFVVPFRDLLFGSLAFPVSMFVTSSFWILYLYDRKLVYPESLDAYIPVWMNHAMHTSIFPFALIELFSVPRRYPSERKRLLWLIIGCLGYIAWSVHIYSVTGKWAYPILDVLSPLSKIAFFLGSCGVVAFYSQTGAFLWRMIWGDSVVIFDASKRKSK